MFNLSLSLSLDGAVWFRLIMISITILLSHCDYWFKFNCYDFHYYPRLLNPVVLVMRPNMRSFLKASGPGTPILKIFPRMNGGPNFQN